MLDLDEALFTELIGKVQIQNRVIADIGCGTGRHWEKLYSLNPARLIGFDVSEGMLSMLKKRFMKAETYKLESNRLGGLKENSCDIIISTLAMAHIKDVEDAFTEWNRILKPNGQILITDYHPEALHKGGNRTFMHDGKLVAIKNYIHPIEQVKQLLEKYGFDPTIFIEKKIDESVKHYYAKQDALQVFERFNGTPIIYGMLLTRKNAAA